MATGTFEYRTDAERVAIERAIAFVAEMHDLALAVPSGQVLDRCEQQATDRGGISSATPCDRPSRPGSMRPR